MLSVLYPLHATLSGEPQCKTICEYRAGTEEQTRQAIAASVRSSGVQRGGKLQGGHGGKRKAASGEKGSCMSAINSDSNAGGAGSTDLCTASRA